MSSHALPESADFVKCRVWEICCLVPTVSAIHEEQLSYLWKNKEEELLDLPHTSHIIYFGTVGLLIFFL